MTIQVLVIGHAKRLAGLRSVKAQNEFNPAGSHSNNGLVFESLNRLQVERETHLKVLVK